MIAAKLSIFYDWLCPTQFSCEWHLPYAPMAAIQRKYILLALEVLRMPTTKGFGMVFFFPSMLC